MHNSSNTYIPVASPNLLGLFILVFNRQFEQQRKCQNFTYSFLATWGFHVSEIFNHIISEIPLKGSGQLQNLSSVETIIHTSCSISRLTSMSGIN